MKRIDKLTTELTMSNTYYSYDGVLSETKAQKIQEEHEKHPAGYGFFKHKVENGVTTWQSFNCCD